jgi:ribosomal protein S27E
MVEQHYPAVRELRAMAGRPLPDYVEEEFGAYLKCGRMEEGFLRLRCEQCHAEKLVAFSCKKRGFCPSCGARRMAETAALLAEEVLPDRPLRQWVLSLLMALRFLLATNPAALSQVLGVVYRTISATPAAGPRAHPRTLGRVVRDERRNCRSLPDALPVFAPIATAPLGIPKLARR